MNDEVKKPLSKPLIVLVILFLLAASAPVGYYFFVIPRHAINALKVGYVDVDVKKGKVEYSITSKKPKNWVSHSEVNYVAMHAIVVSEDWLFYEHKGYDIEQIKKALEDKIEKGERLRGASTISQQVVKNLFLSHERSFLRKFNELFFTLYMERNLSKTKILEIYMNIVEFGPELYGIKPASQKYFQKVPKELGPREGAFLAMLLPNPKKYSQSFREKKLTEFARASIDEILEKMVVAGYIKREELDEAKAKLFSWESAEDLIPGQTDGAVKPEGVDSGKIELEQKKIEPLKSKAQAKRKRKSKDSQSDYVPDSSLQLEENPEFDKDAIIEDTSGLEEEFSLE